MPEAPAPVEEFVADFLCRALRRNVCKIFVAALDAQEWCILPYEDKGRKRIDVALCREKWFPGNIRIVKMPSQLTGLGLI
jgi:hypothetical protein